MFRYVPYVRDSKRAMDEYISEIFMGGRSTIAVHNTCEDSLLAAPIILDLVILAELMSRIQFGKVQLASLLPSPERRHPACVKSPQSLAVRSLSMLLFTACSLPPCCARRAALLLAC